MAEHVYFRVWSTPTGYAVGTFSEWGNTACRNQTWYYKTEAQVHAKVTKLFDRGLPRRRGFQEVDRDGNCLHFNTEESISFFGDPNYRYCRDCKVILRREGDVWLVHGEVRIDKVSVR